MQSEDIKEKLRSAACDVAERMYEEKLPHDDAIEILRKKFPGLDEEMYQDALSKGLFSMR